MSNIRPGLNNPFKAQLSYNLSEKTLPLGNFRGEKGIFMQRNIIQPFIYETYRKGKFIYRYWSVVTWDDSDWLQMGMMDLFRVTEMCWN